FWVSNTQGISDHPGQATQPAFETRPRTAQLRGKVVPVRPTSATVPVGIVRGLRDRLPSCEVERFGICPAVVLGQDLTEVARPVRDGAVADLAAGDRKMGKGHREAAGR